MHSNTVQIRQSRAPSRSAMRGFWIIILAGVPLICSSSGRKEEGTHGVTYDDPGGGSIVYNTSTGRRMHMLSPGSMFEITHPPSGSTLQGFGEDVGALRLFYLYTPRIQPILKVDVMGFPNPDGWDFKENGEVLDIGEGLFEGNIRMWGLDAGAVTIRLRCISADGNNAVAEGTVKYFMRPADVKSRVMKAHPWLLQFVEERGARDRRERDVGLAGLRAQHSNAEHKNDSPSAHGEEPGQISPSCTKVALGFCEGRSVPIATETGVLGLMHGYDAERLFPFVESLRNTGYVGGIFLIPVNPEISCEVGKILCERIRVYLGARDVHVLEFPHEIDINRQHQDLHTGLISLQLIGGFAASERGCALARLLVVDTQEVFFQAPPPLSPPSLLLYHPPGSSVESRQADDCFGTSLENFGLLAGVMGGTPHFIRRFAGHAILEQIERFFTRGLQCGVSYTVMLTHVVRTWEGEQSVGFRNGGSSEEFFYVRAGQGGAAVWLADRQSLCLKGAREGRVCGKEGVGRQECLNLGCCWGGALHGGGYDGGALAHSPVACFYPSKSSDEDDWVLGKGGVESRKGTKYGMVLNWRSNYKVMTSFWGRLEAPFLRYFPPKPPPNQGTSRFRNNPQRVLDMLLNGTWELPHTLSSNWISWGNDYGVTGRRLTRTEVQRCLDGMDVHLFGDSRMRALSFSLMRGVSDEVDDTDDNLKERVVPLESASLCGGNKRYDEANHMACASELGYTLQHGTTTLSFHEMFHLDHGPTLSAMIETIINESRRKGRGVVIIVAIGFHFISQSPFDAGSTIAEFLPYVIDSVWGMDSNNEIAMWLTMEPTGGGPGAWPELELVNSASQRAIRAAGSSVVFDAYHLAETRPDLLTDGSHYSYQYRRVAADLMLDSLCPL